MFSSGLRLLCFACVVLTSEAAIASGAAGGRLSRAKRGTSCAPKFQIVDGHTACLPGSDASEKGSTDQQVTGTTPPFCLMAYTCAEVSPADRKLIVDKHNDFRANPSPTASNMMKLRWDDEVAMIAQKWADNCKFEHDRNARRSVPGRFSMGQNVALNAKSWTVAIDLWHKEVDDFTYGDPNYEIGKIGHYTQIMWAETTLIGCGVQRCNRKNLHVCNYAKAGNYRSSIHKPYKQGAPCDDCPGHCVDSALCDCDRTCLNGGTLDLTTCQCSCKIKYEVYAQPDCSLNCTGTSDEGWCASRGKCPSERPNCPHKCNLCPYAGAGYKGQAPKKNGGYRQAAAGVISCTAALLLLLLHLL